MYHYLFFINLLAAPQWCVVAHMYLIDLNYKSEYKYIIDNYAFEGIQW